MKQAAVDDARRQNSVKPRASESRSGTLPLGANAFVSPIAAAPAKASSRGVRAVRRLLAVSASAAVAALVLAAMRWRHFVVHAPRDVAGSPAQVDLPPITALPASGAFMVQPGFLSTASVASALTDTLSAEAITTPPAELESAASRAPIARPVATEFKRPRHREAPTRRSLTRAQVLSRMHRVEPAVQGCFGAQPGIADVRLRVAGSTGRVTSTVVEGVQGRTARCISRALRRARFPRFARASLEIVYPFASP